MGYNSGFKGLTSRLGGLQSRPGHLLENNKISCACRALNSW